MRAVGSAGEVRWVIESRSRRRMPGRAACAETAASDAFQQPIAYADVRGADYDGLPLPGGHAAGMKVYLESVPLQALVAAAFDRQMPVGAICHGGVLAARWRGVEIPYDPVRVAYVTSGPHTPPQRDARYASRLVVVAPRHRERRRA